MPKPLSQTMAIRLSGAKAHAENLIRQQYHSSFIVKDLVQRHGAIFGYYRGTYRLKIAGVEVLNTHGDRCVMIHKWLTKAAGRLDAEGRA